MIKRVKKINLSRLRNEVEDIEANNIILSSLNQHIRTKELLENSLKKIESTENPDEKTVISLSNSINGCTKSIIACLNGLLYIEEEEVNPLDDLFKGLKGGN